ncbi:hypothetical protein HDV62DRAFT_257586 [Trichoderma sp. SZMC 28011]
MRNQGAIVPSQKDDLVYHLHDNCLVRSCHPNSSLPPSQIVQEMLDKVFFLLNFQQLQRLPFSKSGGFVSAMPDPQHRVLPLRSPETRKNNAKIQQKTTTGHSYYYTRMHAHPAKKPPKTPARGATTCAQGDKINQGKTTCQRELDDKGKFHEGEKYQPSKTPGSIWDGKRHRTEIVAMRAQTPLMLGINRPPRFDKKIPTSHARQNACCRLFSFLFLNKIIRHE